MIFLADVVNTSRIPHRATVNIYCHGSAAQPGSTSRILHCPSIATEPCPLRPRPPLRPARCTPAAAGCASPPPPRQFEGTDVCLGPRTPGRESNVHWTTTRSAWRRNALASGTPILLPSQAPQLPSAFKPYAIVSDSGPMPREQAALVPTPPLPQEWTVSRPRPLTLPPVDGPTSGTLVGEPVLRMEAVDLALR